jgi:ABC-type lipoprotein release transport system permease subunit
MTEKDKKRWTDRLWALISGVITGVILSLVIKGAMIDGFREELAEQMAEMRGNIEANCSNYSRLNTDFREHVREDDARDHRQDQELARHEERIQWFYDGG